MAEQRLRVSSLDAALAALLLEFLLLGLVGGEVGLDFALVFETLALGAKVREDGVDAGAERVLLLGGLLGGAAHFGLWSGWRDVWFESFVDCVLEKKSFVFDCLLSCLKSAQDDLMRGRHFLPCERV